MDFLDKMSWVIVLLMIIAIAFVFFYIGDSRSKVIEDCTSVCERKNMAYHNFDYEGDGKLCKCIDSEDRIQEFGIK